MLEELGKRAKQASRVLMTASAGEKNTALVAISNALRERLDFILQQNALDLEAAEKNGMSRSMLDRLSLDEKRVFAIADAVKQVALLDDPVGKVEKGFTRPNGLKIEKVTVPLGVIAVIFEARPNVTADAASLCLKAGNAVILRGGKEAFCSNSAIAEVMREALFESGLPKDCIQLVKDTTRESASALMRMNEYVDVLIPRGGAGLIRACVENSTVPVIQTGTGNCHVYIDEFADIKKAEEIVFNAKVSRPSVCNACESLVVHKAAAERILPAVCERLREAGVTIRGDGETVKLIPYAVPASEEDFGKEFLSLDISVKIVGGIKEAVSHIMKYSTGHSECIVTENYENARYFTMNVDAAAVYVNASTRFTDGGEFGFGAEIGISTQKLHARGPLGLPELTTFKYLVFGDGQVR